MEEVIQDTEKKGCSGCASRCGKLNVYDWLDDLPANMNTTDIVEIQFKNTRKGYYRNSNGLRIEKGDVVAVEASPGHDIGTVTLTGELVLLQMKKHNIKLDTFEFKRVYRKAKPVDIEKWDEARALEHETMLESRRIAERLKLDMKIGDVEYQGDKTKAIFYYIADERVDFRQLIKVLAETFRVRIEMRQIGARQEAGRIGGIGPCGRELCCSTWMTNFVSVTTNAARYQEISLNPQKLAGQCGKLKCCLNYELDAYIDAQQDFPKTNIVLETVDGNYYHFKTDIFSRTMWYSTDKDIPAGIVTVSVDRVKEVIRQNRKGKKVERLANEVQKPLVAEPTYDNVIGQESLTRFDEQKKKRRRNSRRKNGGQQKPDAKPEAKTSDNKQGASQPAGAKKPFNKSKRRFRPNNQRKQQGGNGQNKKE
ncbi:PSP1 domain-containing protein [Carboxylicivirga taeanensis]|uniref:PSP1 domain-containing protein n=1 Tax=Carboxylicivirga taeanensis TaxID=1416875 RepID=UPI003F6DD1D4